MRKEVFLHLPKSPPSTCIDADHCGTCRLAIALMPGAGTGPWYFAARISSLRNQPPALAPNGPHMPAVEDVTDMAGGPEPRQLRLSDL